ncbi:MAG: SPFH domain-containing protein [Pseudomonadota bacterium]
MSEKPRSKRRSATEVFAASQAPAAAPENNVAAKALMAGADDMFESSYPYQGVATSEELQLENEPVQVRETGFLLWKQVIVPPNAYVVHTRIGARDPVTIGLGKSFRYNPYTDAYLVVPAAMQTIGVVANSITQEKQGINVLAYLQWQIDDFATAYRKLDFSDSRDPLGIVNAQLREQAEAAIKDKISTMSVEEVLTDKAPVIEELTTRLKAVAEGREQEDADGQGGLGIKIVTVQIREAFVSSQKLWRDLQSPFRHEQQKAARISELQMQDEIHQKELESRQAKEVREAEANAAIEKVQQVKQTEAQTLRLQEETARFEQEQGNAQEAIRLGEVTALAKAESDQKLTEQQAAFELQKQAQQAELEKAELLAKVERDKKAHQAELERLKASNQLKLAQLQEEQTIYNQISDGELRRRLIDKLPEIVEALPEIQELKVLQSGEGNPGIAQLDALMMRLSTMLSELRVSDKPAEVPEKE